VYDAYFAFVWRCTRRFGVPADAVGDLVHDTFATAHARLASRECTECLRRLLYDLVRRKVGAYQRAERVREARTSMPFLIDDTADAMRPSPDDLGRLSHEVQATWRVLLRLEPRDREVLILADLDRASLPEVAETLGIEAHAVHLRLWAARRAFKKATADVSTWQRRKAHTGTTKAAARGEAGRIAEWLHDGALLLRFGPGMFSPSADDRDRVLASLMRTLGPAATGPTPIPRAKATRSRACLSACGWIIGGLSVLVVMAFAPWLHSRALKGAPSALEPPGAVVPQRESLGRAPGDASSRPVRARPRGQGSE
jgi:RNA polymerase sigma-70 factor (ECF subfamily)